MKFKEFGSKDKKAIVLLHGGGLSWWSLQKLVDILEKDFYVITPIIDGHGENGEDTFLSIEDSAKKLIDYIDSNFHGKVLALGGLSLGAQIVTEVLSERTDIAEYAIIESALVLPIPGTAVMASSYKLIFGLIKQRWFSKIQAKSMAVPEEWFELYYADSSKMSKQSLINITLSNGNYNLKNSISNTKAKVLVIVGEKEISIMKKSAQKLHAAISGSELYVARKLRHGELSIAYPQKYTELFQEFLRSR